MHHGTGGVLYYFCAECANGLLNIMQEISGLQEDETDLVWDTYDLLGKEKWGMLFKLYASGANTIAEQFTTTIHAGDETVAEQLSLF
jgi:hypothetical protein